MIAQARYRVLDVEGPRRGSKGFWRSQLASRVPKLDWTEMTPDPLSKLETTIAAAAKERDLKDKQVSDEQAERERVRGAARAIWGARKIELNGIVKSVDRMLKLHGYGGLSIGVFEFKHTDIDRMVLLFEHTPRTYSKILLCAGRTGDFTCSIAGLSGEDVYSVTMPIAELTPDRLKECVAQAAAECLTAEWAPRSERSQ